MRTSSIVVWIGFVLVLPIFFLVPGTNADFAMDVNNVHCAHEIKSGTLSQEVRFSTSPYHDYTGVPVPTGESAYPNIRANCGELGTSSLLSHYSVAPDPVAHIRGELYLGSDDPFNDKAKGATCLKAESLDQDWETDGWQCGSVRTSGFATDTEPKWFPENKHLSIPTTSLAPERVKFKVGFMDDEDEIAVETSSWSNVHHYNGPSTLLAGIEDPTGGNEYLESDEFRSWKIHDPEGDDNLVIGGVPVSMEIDSRIDFPESDVAVTYEASPEGPGNEWRIRHSEDENRVFVWDDPWDDWQIRYLEW